MSEFVWVFHGDGSSFSSGVFIEKEMAEVWIFRHLLSGTLTKMPINYGMYDWVLEKNYFTPKFPSQKNPEFIQNFSSAYLEHHHYRNGCEQPS